MYSWPFYLPYRTLWCHAILPFCSWVVPCEWSPVHKGFAMLWVNMSCLLLFWKLWSYIFWSTINWFWVDKTRKLVLLIYMWKYGSLGIIFRAPLFQMHFWHPPLKASAAVWVVSEALFYSVSLCACFRDIAMRHLSLWLCDVIWDFNGVGFVLLLCFLFGIISTFTWILGWFFLIW